MSTPYIGEIRMFAGTFAPVGWALCHGQLIAISENDTLFNLIGTTYGGDGQETFALPDLRGRAPAHYGQGPGISQSYVIGEPFGVEEVTLTVQQIPVHGHALQAHPSGGESASAEGRLLASAPGSSLYVRDTPATDIAPAPVGTAGGSQPHENRMPYLTVNFIISLFGIFPTQT
jgi:microcystin-dependent protein